MDGINCLLKILTQNTQSFVSDRRTKGYFTNRLSLCSLNLFIFCFPSSSLKEAALRAERLSALQPEVTFYRLHNQHVPAHLKGRCWWSGSDTNTAASKYYIEKKTRYNCLRPVEGSLLHKNTQNDLNFFIYLKTVTWCSVCAVLFKLVFTAVIFLQPSLLQRIVCIFCPDILYRHLLLSQLSVGHNACWERQMTLQCQRNISMFRAVWDLGDLSE